jgi:hypothetical protein
MSTPWPATLQGFLNTADFGYDIGETATTSEMDTGPKKKRRLFTKAIDRMSCSVELTKAQYITLYTFYDSSLNGGVNLFSFNHPITGISTDWRFAEPPKIIPLGGEMFRVQMSWEKMS